MTVTVSEGSKDDLEITFSRIVDNERDDYFVYMNTQDMKEFFRAISATTRYYIANIKTS